MNTNIESAVKAAAENLKIAVVGIAAAVALSGCMTGEYATPPFNGNINGRQISWNKGEVATGYVMRLESGGTSYEWADNNGNIIVDGPDVLSTNGAKVEPTAENAGIFYTAVREVGQEKRKGGVFPFF